MDQAVGATPGLLLNVKCILVQGKNMYGLMGSGKWPDCLFKFIKGKSLESRRQGGMKQTHMDGYITVGMSVKIFLSHIHDHQTVSTIEKELDNEVDSTN